MSGIIKEFYYQIRYALPIWFIQLVTSFFPECGPTVKFRGYLVSLFLPGRPKGFLLGESVTLLSIHKLIIGGNVYIAKGCWINAIGSVVLKDEVVLSPYVVVASSSHAFKNGSTYKGGSVVAPILIGKGTWVASHSVICSGIEIGSGVLIGANSVVTKNISDNKFAVGLPAMEVKDRIDNPSSMYSKHEVS